MSKERRLGRGLAALLGEEDDLVSVGPEVLRDDEPDEAPKADAEGRFEDGQVVLLSVDQIEGNPFQPRRDFSQSEIASLAESLKEHDMLQPVLVRRWKGHWQLISGERRLRAAVQAGWKKVPARIRNADDRLVAELAIVENLQRKDLNPIEKALSFRRYLDQHRCKQEDLAQRIKIDRSTIANLMRLLELPEPIRQDLQTGSITVGHARALLPLGDEALQLEYAERIRREGLNVRDIEHLVQERIEQEEEEGREVSPRRGRRGRRQRSAQIASLEQQLRVALGTKVDIHESGSGRGRIVVHFRGPEEFERLQQVLLGDPAEPVSRMAG